MEQNIDTQTTFFEGIFDLFQVGSMYLFGGIVVALLLILVALKNPQLRKLRYWLASFAFYYYLCILLVNVTSFPSISIFRWQLSVGEGWFNPNFNFQPLIDGLSFGFIMNILVFLPFGFLVPFISGKFAKWWQTLLLGFSFSLIIEIGQLFLLYRATDVDDLLANSLGALLGFILYWLIVRKLLPKMRLDFSGNSSKFVAWLPVLIIVVSLVTVFVN